MYSLKSGGRFWAAALVSALPLDDGWCDGADAAVFCLRAVWDRSRSTEYVFIVEP